MNQIESLELEIFFLQEQLESAQIKLDNLHKIEEVYRQLPNEELYGLTDTYPPQRGPSIELCYSSTIEYTLLGNEESHHDIFVVEDDYLVQKQTGRKIHVSFVDWKRVLAIKKVIHFEDSEYYPHPKFFGPPIPVADYNEKYYLTFTMFEFSLNYSWYSSPPENIQYLLDFFNDLFTEDNNLEQQTKTIS